jgi:hypothetical protein
LALMGHMDSVSSVASHDQYINYTYHCHAYVCMHIYVTAD